MIQEVFVTQSELQGPEEMMGLRKRIILRRKKLRKTSLHNHSNTSETITKRGTKVVDLPLCMPEGN